MLAVGIGHWLKKICKLFPLRSKICKIYLGKFTITFFELQRANFSEFLGFGQIAYGIGQLLCSSDCAEIEAET